MATQNAVDDISYIFKYCIEKDSYNVFKITLDKDDFITLKHLEQIYILNGTNSLLFFGHNLMLKEIQHAVCLRKTNHILLTGTFIQKNAQHNF